jgi:hypothetical protein
MVSAAATTTATWGALIIDAPWPQQSLGAPALCYGRLYDVIADQEMIDEANT